MSLASKDINLILNFLNEDTCGSSFTLEQISAQFQQSISKSDYLRVGNALVLLLQNRDLLPTAQQRLIILFLFHDMYKGEPQSIHLNPFAPVFTSILQTSSTDTPSTQKHFHWLISPVSAHERWFVKALIHNHTKDLLKKTPNQILQSGLPRTGDDFGHEQLKEKLEERTRQLPVIVQCHLPAVIDDPEVNYVSFPHSPRRVTHRFDIGAWASVHQRLIYCSSDSTRSSEVHVIVPTIADRPSNACCPRTRWNKRFVPNIFVSFRRCTNARSMNSSGSRPSNTIPLCSRGIHRCVSPITPIRRFVN